MMMRPSMRTLRAGARRVLDAKTFVDRPHLALNRKCLMILLHEKAFGPEDALGSDRGKLAATTRRVSPLISWGAMERIYPRYPTIGSVRLTEEERRGWIDLRPYVNTAPYVINGGCPRRVPLRARKKAFIVGQRVDR